MTYEQSVSTVVPILSASTTVMLPSSFCRVGLRARKEATASLNYFA